MTMNHYKSLPVCFAFVFLGLVVSSCSNEQPEQKALPVETAPVAPPPSAQNNTPASQLPQISSDKIETRVFEVKDHTGKAKGWGYDIYVDGKKMIHQPIIPAIPGNDAFKTEKDALTVGTLAADKMKKSGSLPTISVNELDSLGVIKK